MQQKDRFNDQSIKCNWLGDKAGQETSDRRAEKSDKLKFHTNSVKNTYMGMSPGLSLAPLVSVEYYYSALLEQGPVVLPAELLERGALEACRMEENKWSCPAQPLRSAGSGNHGWKSKTTSSCGG